MKLGSTIFILGAGGFARELKTYLQGHIAPHNRSSGQIHTRNEFIHAVGPFKKGCEIYLVAPDGDMTVKEYHNKLNKLSRDCYSIMGSGQCHIKNKMLEEIRGSYLSFIHPAAIIIDESMIGKGSVVAPSAVIAPRVVVGEHVLINYGANVGHDAIIGNLSTVSPGAFIGGFCKLGKSVYIGANASIKENTKIGTNSVIAMGSVVTKDVPANSIAIGVPAMIFPLNEWGTIKMQLSSNINRDQNNLRKKF